MPTRLVLGIISLLTIVIISAVFIIYGFAIRVTGFQIGGVALMSISLLVFGIVYYFFFFQRRGRKKVEMNLQKAWEISKAYAYSTRGIKLSTKDVTQSGPKRVGINYAFGFYAYQDIENTKEPMKPVQIIVSNIMSSPNSPRWDVVYFNDKPPTEAKVDPFIDWRGTLEGAPTDKLIAETEPKVFQGSIKERGQPAVSQKFYYERLKEEEEKKEIGKREGE